MPRQRPAHRDPIDLAIAVPLVVLAVMAVVAAVGIALT
jgi:hypothetical protein